MNRSSVTPAASHKNDYLRRRFMITVTETIPSFETFSETLGYEPSGSLFFDIETTGFSPSSSLLFLVGTLELQEETWKLTQYLAEHPDDERRIVEAFFTSASRHSTLLHFNGSTFDLPYLTKKAAHYGISHTLGQTASVDLYQKFRPLGKLLPLTQKNQKAFEEFLGWRRSDRLSGKHMLSLFPKFAASAEPGLCSLLLGHNHDDMIGMTKLLQMAAYLELLDGTGADAVSAFCTSSGSGPYHKPRKNTEHRLFSETLPSKTFCSRRRFPAHSLRQQRAAANTALERYALLFFC